MWVEIRCIRYDKIAKQNVSWVSRGKALPARHLQKPAITIYHDSSHSRHVLSTCFTSREGFLQATRKNSFGLQFAMSLHTLSHTQLLQWNPTYNTGYIRLNKITIKFGAELKPTQNSCKSQLYNVYFLSTLVMDSTWRLSTFYSGTDPFFERKYTKGSFEDSFINLHRLRIVL